ncbi:MAG: ammonia-forming cytochrome c nitrite reductase subunit c552, partial [Anaeromusa sp.]
DYVAAANSMGFHSPVQAQRNLGQALDLSYKAIEKANQAAGRGGF